MHKRITFRSMDRSDAIEKYIYKNIAKLDKFLKREPLPINIEMVLEAHREKQYFNVEFKLNSTHYHIVVKTEGHDMYAMIDEAIYIMIKDITRKKEKMGHELHFSYGV
jgi:ribosomal subunit interface protein